jgi:bacteriocin-type transport-associated protein
LRKVLFILSELADADLDWMVQNGARRAVPRGTVLIREGQPISELYVLLDGSLSVTLSALQGREIARLRSGEVLGELSFLDSRPPSATVAAAEEASVLAISRERLSAKLEQDLGFAARFYRALGVFLAARLRRTQARLGYGPDDVPEQGADRGDELDPQVLGGVALAGARFDWMLRRLRGEPPR